MTAHLVTGATGFVGSAILLDLLARTDAPLFGLVRPTADMSPTLRLRGVLHELADAYALGDAVHAAIDARIEAVAGDVWEPHCGVAEVASLRGAVVWHCAASLQYQDRHREQIFRTNVDGTRHLVQLAEAAGASRVYMLSTAYVAGSRTGRILPEAARAEHVNNHYERSKIEAEGQLAALSMPHWILRPAIVIGHSRTLHALNFNGMYGFVRGLTKFRSALERMQPGLAGRMQVQLRAAAEGPLGLVAVDHVAQDAVGLFLVDAEPGIYHLVNPTPPSIREAIEHAFDLTGLHPPTFVGLDAELSSIDARLADAVDFYNAYIQYPKHFDRSSTEAALGKSVSPGVALSDGVVREFIAWYTDRLQAEASALPVAR